MSVARILEWLFAAAGAVVCLAGAMSAMAAQAQFLGPGESLWPLPALALIEFALLGVSGFAAAAIRNPKKFNLTNLILWSVCGALLALALITGFSIGPVVLLSAIFFLLAGLMGVILNREKLWQKGAALLVGIVANFLLIFIFINISYL